MVHGEKRADDGAQCTRRSALTIAAGGVFSLMPGVSRAADWRGSHKGSSNSLYHAVATEVPSPADLGTRGPVKVQVRPPEMRRWPPHGPTDRYMFTDSLQRWFGASEAYLLADLQDNLLSKEVGYPKVSFFGSPGGISALATPFERFLRDGSPAKQNRFNLAPLQKQTPLGEKGIPLHARSIVYFVTPNAIPVPEGDPPKNFARHKTALEAGAHLINDDWQFVPVTHRHRLWAFVYEYHGDGSGDPVFLQQSPLKVRDHLIKTGVIPK